MSELERFTQARLEQMRLNLKAQEMRLQITEQFKKTNQASYLPSAGESYEPGIIGTVAGSEQSGLSLADPATTPTEAEDRALFVRNLSELVGSNKASQIEPKFSADAVEAGNTSWVQLKAALQGHFKKSPATMSKLVSYIATWLATTYGVQMALMVPQNQVPIAVAPLTPNSILAANQAAALLGTNPQAPTPPTTPAPAPAPVPPAPAPAAPAPAPAAPAPAAPAVPIVTTPSSPSQAAPTPAAPVIAPNGAPVAHPQAAFPLGGDTQKYAYLQSIYDAADEAWIQDSMKTSKIRLFSQLDDIGVDVTQDHTLVVLDGVAFANKVQPGTWINKNALVALCNAYIHINRNGWMQVIAPGTLTKNNTVKPKGNISDIEKIVYALCDLENDIRSGKSAVGTSGRGMKPLRKVYKGTGANAVQRPVLYTGAVHGAVKKKNPNNIRLVLGGGMPNHAAIQHVTNKLVEKAQRAEASRWYVPGRPTLFLELGALDRNQIRLKYSTSSLYKLTADISDAGRLLVQGVILRDAFDARLFAQLPIQERRVIETLLQSIRKSEVDGYPGPMSLADLSENLTIYQGQIQAGNNDPRLKVALRDVVEEMKRLKHMTPARAKSILAQL